MDTPIDRLKKIYARYGTNASDIEMRYKEIEPKTKFSKQTLYNIESGETKSLTSKNAGILLRVFPDLNLEWLVAGVGLMAKSNSIFDKPTAPEPNPDKTEKPKVILTDQNSKQIHEGEDYIWLETQKIPEKAGLSLATNYFAEVYLEELEKGKVRVKREHFGKYWEVEATGDSMNDGTNRILDKDWFLARDIPRDKWKNKLHINSWNAFYFLHNERGHIIKEVKSHNAETGEILLHSWNEDKELYGDFTINIRDCYIVANIVKLINRDFNVFY